ncbi:MAG: Gfo/Idh/MocA family oxidoreductase [Planctomycetota bacterium]
MTRIGFVDDDLNNFHADTYLKAIRGPLAGRGFTVAGCTALQSDAGRTWAAANETPYFEGPAQMAAEVDVFAVLAPSKRATHFPLCERVLPLGKPTFVDKTFAPDPATAERIFQMADAHGVPVQSTSALRTTAIQGAVQKLSAPLTAVNVWAGGSTFDEYGVHPVEIAVSCLGPGVERLTRAGGEAQFELLVEFAGGRTATINFNAGEYVPFRAALTTAKGTEVVGIDDQALFTDAASAILDFFEAGQALVPREETLAVMRLLEAAERPGCRTSWVSVG